MIVLAVVHGAKVPPGIFADEIRRRGHGIEEWSLAWGTPPPRPVDDYGAVLLFGGSMHADQDDHHPWLRDESLLIERLLDQHVPLLGVCLGAQLIAKAAHADVHACERPEVGWVDVELTEDAADDPLFSGFPEQFPAFQWHYYEYGVPAGACELARSKDCSQAFRLGDVAWGVQFHPEVTREIVADWVADEPEAVPDGPETFLAELENGIVAWNELGRTLCGSFVEAAERIAVPA
jgi:GMP synthase (glutamine-hydrolysing)